MKDKGFTLIELVMIIVLLGILAAVAIPRYQDISTNAKHVYSFTTYETNRGVYN